RYLSTQELHPTIGTAHSNPDILPCSQEEGLNEENATAIRDMRPNIGPGENYQDVEFLFENPISHFEVVSIDTDEAITLRGFDAEGNELATDTRCGASDTAAVLLDIDAPEGKTFSRVVLDMVPGGPEFYDNVKVVFEPAFTVTVQP
ncbi:MAG: hypothetical protein D6795_18025, partial [Deltaproteobacteria bacterium]